MSQVQVQVQIQLMAGPDLEGQDQVWKKCPRPGPDWTLDSLLLAAETLSKKLAGSSVLLGRDQISPKNSAERW